MKAGRRELPIKDSEGGDIQEVTVSLAAKEVSVDVLGGIFTFREEQRAELKAFLCGEDVLAFSPDWLWRELS